MIIALNLTSTAHISDPNNNIVNKMNNKLDNNDNDNDNNNNNENDDNKKKEKKKKNAHGGKERILSINSGNM